MEERLQKVLARAGIASRRACETLIAEGRIKVDGRVVTELGTKVDPQQSRIEVDGRPVKGEEPHIYILLYKPKGYVTTVSDPQGRRTVLDLVNGVGTRIYPVGRLDYDTSGLLLLTNDGELTHALIHPSHQVEKMYRAVIAGRPSHDKLARLRYGLKLTDGITAPAKVSLRYMENDNAVIDITIHEGKNRQVRRMFEAIGHPVIFLKRISFAFLTLDNLKPGDWRHLTTQETKRLKRLLGKKK